MADNSWAKQTPEEAKRRERAQEKYAAEQKKAADNSWAKQTPEEAKRRENAQEKYAAEQKKANSAKEQTQHEQDIRNSSREMQEEKFRKVMEDSSGVLNPGGFTPKTFFYSSLDNLSQDTGHDSFQSHLATVQKKQAAARQTQHEQDIRNSSHEMEAYRTEKASAPYMLTRHEREIRSSSRENENSKYRANLTAPNSTELQTLEPLRQKHYDYLPDDLWEEYVALRKREAQLAPEMDEAVEKRAGRTDLYIDLAKKYRENQSFTDDEYTLELARNTSAEMAAEEELIKEYKYIDSELRKYEVGAFSRNSDGGIDVESGVSISEAQGKRSDRIASTNYYTEKEMAELQSGTADVGARARKGETEDYFNRRMLSDKTVEAFEYYDKNKDNNYGNNLFGRAAGNYKVSRIGIKSNDANYTSYLADDTQFAAAAAYNELTSVITGNNTDTFENNGVLSRKWAELWQYAPQFADQVATSAVGMLVGAGAGFLVSGGNAAVAKQTARLGSAALSADYMFRQTAGSSYYRLMQNNPDISVEDAQTLAKSEAVAAGVIEFGLDFATSGIFTGTNAVSNGAVNKLFINAEEKIISQLTNAGLKRNTANAVLDVSKQTAKMALSSFSEGSEEWMQAGLSFTADRVASEGREVTPYGLFLESFDYSQYTDEELAEMKKSFKQGAFLSPFGSTIQTALYGTVNAMAVRGAGNDVVGSGFGEAVLDAALSADGTKSQTIAKTVLAKMEDGKTVTTADWGVLSGTMKEENIKMSPGAKKDSGKYIFTKDSGGLASTIAGSKLSADKRWQLNRLGQITGKNIIPVANGENGWIDTKDKSKFYVNVNSARPIQYTAVHELTHTGIGNKDYEAYKKYVISNTKKTLGEEQYNDMVRAVKQKYLQVQKSFISKSVAEDEIVADAAMRLNSNYSEMLKVLDENPRFGQQMVDKLVDLYQNIFRLNDVRGLDPMKNAEAAEVKQALELWTKAAQETGVDRFDMPAVMASTDYFEIFRASPKVISEFSQQIDSWLNRTIGTNETLKLGDTPVVLRQLGAKNLPVEMNQDVLVKMTGEKHTISLDDIKQLPDVIADPVMVFKSNTVNNAYVILTELFDKSGKDVVVALHLNKYQDRIKINRIASVYGKDNIGYFVDNQIKFGNLKYMDKNKSQKWSTSRGLQLPKLVQSNPDNNIILYKDDIVNTYYANNTEKDTEEIYSMDYSEVSDGGKKVSKVYSNSLQKKAFEGIRDEVDARKDEFLYKGISNKATYDKAVSNIEDKGYDKAVSEIMLKAVSDKEWTALDNVTALVLMTHYQTEGDVEKAVDIASAIRKKATRSGQSNQSYAIINKLTPAGKFIMVSRDAEEINQKAEEKVRKKGKKAADELERAKKKDRANARKAAGEQMDLTDVLEKPERKEVKDITEVLKKPGTEVKEQTVQKKTTSKEVGQQKKTPTKKKASEKSEVEKVFEKYGVKYVSKDKLTKISKTFEMIDKLKTKEDLINLIMKQSKARNTVTSDKLRSELNKMNVVYLKDTANQQLFGMIRDITPVSFWKKVATAQTMAMLSGVPTYLRNIISNMGFNPEEGLAWNLAYIMDSAIGAVGWVGNRVVTSFTGGEKKKFTKSLGLNKGMFRKGSFDAKVENARKKYIDIALDIETGADLSKKQENIRGRSFRKGPFALGERLMSYGLGVTDEYTKGGIEHDIYQGLKAMKNQVYTDEEMRAIAEMEARYRTFQDDNWVSYILSGLKELFNFNLGKHGDDRRQFGMGDILFKFTQVPGALISRGIEFSPAGYVKALYHLINFWKPEEIPMTKRRNFCLAFARATTGTGMAAAGYMLAKMGVISFSGDEEDKDLKNMKKAEGLNGLQINVSKLGRIVGGEYEGTPEPQKGDKLISIGFFEPVNKALTAGAVLANGDEGVTLEQIWNIYTSQSFEDIGEISAMQTIRTINYARQSGNSAPVDIAIALASQGVSGFVPAPVRQSARVVDPVQRNPYKTRDPLLKAKQSLMMNIPGLSQKVPAKITPLGEEKSNDLGETWKNVLNNFLNPAYLSVYQPGKMSEKIYELAEYNPGALPKTPPSYFTVDGERHNISGSAYEEWSEIIGKNTDTAIAECMSSQEYAHLDIQGKADRVAQAVNDAFSKSKVDFLELKMGKKVKTPIETEEDIIEAFEEVSDFKGLPGKMYIEYDGTQYELSDEDAAKYLKLVEANRQTLKQQVVIDGVPLNSISGFEKKYATDWDGERVKLDKPYSAYPMSIKKKIIDKLETGAKEQAKNDIQEYVKSHATAKYVSDDSIEAALDSGDFSKTRWVRQENVEEVSSEKVSSVLVNASKYVGVPYVWGGTTPKGFDCSGFTQYVMRESGVSISRTAAQQFKNGKPVNKSELYPGDLVFFRGSRGTSKAPGHVGIYIGDGKFVHSPRKGDVVKTSSLSGRNDYVGARRVIGN